ncbi:MAG: bifunctional methylenetetrahydrofolate dehydrogenase/methenyltetrahydrofolate cyclohydrolase FolD [Clostridia bacterium]|nr:bifunctional methylenetetrahydrofolate dehydrogenase/methenyltetrahydrofolate cyclohydrolase FolD [Clostridia bacterium]
MGQIIDGKAISASVRAQLKRETELLIGQTGYTPALAVILVGDDPASAVYVRNKQRACAEIGFRALEYRLPASTSQKELDDLIDALNADDTVDGILVQLPLPHGLDEQSVLLRIRPDKDVDCFHPYNVGRVMTGKSRLAPCTPMGVMELIHSTGVDVAGKECVVIGRSNIVGKPLSMLLLRENGTVTVCHSKTRDLGAVCRRADILVAAVGRAGLITGDMIKPGAVVIDVGINRTPDGKLTGDVDFATAEPVASYITPVPGGVGPMTIAMLMQNTLVAAKEHLAEKGK